MESKTIEMFGRFYIVESNGTIRRSSGKMLSKYIRKGYEYVALANCGKRVKVSVHRIMACAFLENKDDFSQVNHIDGNPQNNDVSNLEWASASDNQTHSRYTLHNVTGFPDTPVRCVETGKEYRSTREAWRDTGVNYCHISECARGKRKTAGRMHWEGVSK